VLDVKRIVADPETVRRAAAAKNEKRADVDGVLALNEQRRALQTQTDELRRRLKEGSQKVGALKKQGDDAAALVAANRALGDEISALEERIRNVEAALHEKLQWIPNPAAEDVPVHPGAEGDRPVRTVGAEPTFDFAPVPHWEVGRRLGILDFERAAKLAGSNFALFRGDGALLQRGLINFMLDLHAREHGYVEISPPYIANRESMVATGQIPKLEEDMYRLDRDDGFLIPTAEVPVTNLHRDETLAADQLPLRYVSYTACFRREAGAYGADTRALLRVHQFDKVELVHFTHPDRSWDALEALLGHAEEVLKRLGLRYRVVLLSTGSMSFASAKTYDIEAWAPGVKQWLEVSSCSNFTDFQARRGAIRFRDADGKVKLVHTLNGSGVALPRTMIALLETYQQEGGGVFIPPALRPYVGGKSELAPPK
jgi:seryl-tRNA synthetase